MCHIILVTLAKGNSATYYAVYFTLLLVVKDLRL